MGKMATLKDVLRDGKKTNELTFSTNGELKSDVSIEYGSFKCTCADEKEMARRFRKKEPVNKSLSRKEIELRSMRIQRCLKLMSDHRDIVRSIVREWKKHDKTVDVMCDEFIKRLKMSFSYIIKNYFEGDRWLKYANFMEHLKIAWEIMPPAYTKYVYE